MLLLVIGVGLVLGSPLGANFFIPPFLRSHTTDHDLERGESSLASLLIVACDGSHATKELAGLGVTDEAFASFVEANEGMRSDALEDGSLT